MAENPVDRGVTETTAFCDRCQTVRRFALMEAPPPAAPLGTPDTRPVQAWMGGYRTWVCLVCGARRQGLIERRSYEQTTGIEWGEGAGARG